MAVKFAQGGPVVTTRSRFMKSPNTFRDDNEIVDYEKKGKTGTLSKPEGETKVEKPVKPRS